MSKETIEYKAFSELENEKRQKRIDSIINCADLNQDQKGILKKYFAYLQRSNLSLATQKEYISTSKDLILFFKLPKPITEIKNSDIDRYLEHLKKNYKTGSRSLKIIVLFIFFPWYFEKPKADLDFLKDIKTPKNDVFKLPEEILTPAEVKKQVQVADNFRDKSLILTLYETGARNGEFRRIKLKHLDITNTEYGWITIPKGKTKSRKVPIIYAVQHLTNWINSHPDRENPEAPLFPSTFRNAPLTDEGLRHAIQRIANRSGIRKKVFPHIYRHSRYTELGKIMTEQELRVHGGWARNSIMPTIYCHLSGQDAGNKILANAGLIDLYTVNAEKIELQSIKCPRCEQINPCDSKHCVCGFCLDLKEVNKLINDQEQLSNVQLKEEVMRLKELMEGFMKHPQVRAAIEEAK